MAVVCAIAIWNVIDDDEMAPEPDGVEVLVGPGTAVVALDVLPDGRVVYGERLTGRVLVADPADVGEEPQGAPTVLLHEVETEPSGQRGLLGVAADGEGRVFAAWTRSEDGRIVVGQVADVSSESASESQGERLVWVGPQSADGANGGHLEVTPDGQLVIGLGTLFDRAAIDDPDSVKGKLLVLDPDATESQNPTVVSSGWFNPFAFDVADDGTVWLADNGPREDDPERYGRADRPDQMWTTTDQLAPSALLATGDGRILVCGWLDGEIRELEIVDGTPSGLGPRISSTWCTTGIAELPDGRLVVADETRVRVVDLDA